MVLRPTAAQCHLRRSLQYSFRVPRPKEKLHRILDTVLNKKLQLDDIFITGEHQRFLRNRARASSGPESRRSIRNGTKPYFSAAHLGDVYYCMFLNRPG
jgi:hypothetical protein